MLDVEIKSTLSPREDNSVAAFTMHPSTRTTRTCRKKGSLDRQTEEEQNRRREREKGMKKIHESGDALDDFVRTQCV